MKALVTGGAGFIGSNFIEMALSGEIDNFDEIVIVDKMTYAGNSDFIKKVIDDKRIKFHQCDIKDKISISKLMIDVDYIINFAAESHVDNSIKSADEFIQTNILGTQSLLDVALDSGIKKFIQISTDEVYGSIDEGSWDENSPLMPNSPYSASKASADLICRSYFRTHDLPVIITRCSNNFGHRQHSEKMIPTIIRKLKNNQKVPIYGSGLNVRDWLFVKDHILGINIALKHGMKGEIYNIGGGRELTNLELVKIIAGKLTNRKDVFEFVNDRLGHDLRYSVNFQKISELGYQPKFTFENGLQILLDCEE